LMWFWDYSSGSGITVWVQELRFIDYGFGSGC